MKEDSALFHTQDLALLWGVNDRNTLYTTIKRYSDAGVLIPIHKGYYSVKPLAVLDPVELGLGSLHRYGYLSCETILAREGIIFQKIPYITLVSSVSKKNTINGVDYLVRRMDESLLYQSTGLIDTGKYKQATLLRAVADILYFNPRYHFDAHARIDWKKVEALRKKIGFL